MVMFPLGSWEAGIGTEPHATHAIERPRTAISAASFPKSAPDAQTLLDGLAQPSPILSCNCSECSGQRLKCPSPENFCCCVRFGRAHASPSRLGAIEDRKSTRLNSSHL